MNIVHFGMAFIVGKDNHFRGATATHNFLTIKIQTHETTNQTIQIQKRIPKTIQGLQRQLFYRIYRTF